MICLSQVLKGSKVTISTSLPERLTDKGLPVSLKLELDIDPKAELVEYVEREGHPKVSYAGYTYPKDVCNWFSVAIGKDVIAVKSRMDRRTALNKNK